MILAGVFRTVLLSGAVLTLVPIAYGQNNLSIQIDKSLFENGCVYRLYALRIQIQNVTDSQDTKTFEIACPVDYALRLTPEPPPQNVKIVREIQVTRAYAVRLTTDWEAASKWGVIVNDRWIAISDISLPNQSYRFIAYWLGAGAPRILLDEQFVVRKNSGPSVSQFTVQEKSISQMLRDKYFGQQTLYVSLILLLVGLLVAAVRKRAEKVIDQFLDSLGAFGKGQLAVRRFLKRYTDYLLSTHRYLRLIGFGAAGINRPLLEQVFISLRVSPFDRRRFSSEQGTENGISFQNAVNEFSRSVILGGPGAGKTTILSYIILQCVRKSATARRQFSMTDLPLYVPLRRLSNRDTSLLDDILSPETQILPADILRECPQGFIRHELERGKCIVLLDGLDEVIDEFAHKLAADKINRMISEYPKNRFIVTCRIAGWRGLLNDFTVLEAQDLSRNEVHRFVFGWHRAVITQDYRGQIELKYKDSEERAAAWEKERSNIQNAVDLTARRLVNAIESSGRLMAVAKNPMLLSLICLVHYVKNILPRERPILYEKCIELLIDAWDRSRNIAAVAGTINAYQKEAILRSIAVAFQAGGKGEAPRADVEMMVEAESKKLGVQLSGKELLAQIEQRSGILIERSIDVLGFSHLTLQEYLVAKHLRLTGDTALLKTNFDNQEWREVTLLYVGLIDDATGLIQNIIEVDSFPRWLLAGYTLGEARRCAADVTRTIVDRLMSSFGHEDVDGETLINVLSAISTDYPDEPVSPEGQLSARLIQHLETKSSCEGPAIRALAKARITKALPLIVNCLADQNPALVKAAAESIVLFGNIAIPYLRAYIQRRSPDQPVGTIINVLREIDTAEAARLLIECYTHWQTQPDHISISFAIARMLTNETIESELLALRDQDIPEAVGVQFANEEISWAFGDQTGTGFVRLSLRLRDDILSALEAEQNVSDDMRNVSFKITFPAMVCYLRRNKKDITRERWESLGFVLRSDADLTSLERIRKGLRSGQALVRESVKRLIAAGTSAKEVSKVVRVARWPCEIWVSLLFVVDALLCGLIIYTFTERLFTPGPFGVQRATIYAVLLVATMAVSRFIVFEAWAARIAGRGRRFIGLVNAYPTLLRRTPYLISRRPWINFIVLQFGMGLSSLVGALFVFTLDRVIREGSVSSAGEIGILLWPYLCFLAASIWLYRYVALKVDAAALLAIQHPLGRKLLGLPFDSIRPGSSTQIAEELGTSNLVRATASS